MPGASLRSVNDLSLPLYDLLVEACEILGRWRRPDLSFAVKPRDRAVKP